MHYLGRALARLTVSKTQTSTCAEHGQRVRTYQSLASDIPHASSVRVARSHCVLVGCPHRSQGCDRATRTNELRCAPFLSLSLSVAMLEHSGRNSLESARAAPKLQYIRSPSTSNFRGILSLQITATGTCTTLMSNLGFPLAVSILYPTTICSDGVHPLQDQPVHHSAIWPPTGPLLPSSSGELRHS